MVRSDGERGTGQTGGLWGRPRGKNRSRKKVAVVDNESSDIEKSFFLLVSNLMPISADSTTTLIEFKDDKSIE